MNLAKDVLHVLGSLAPTVATAFGGPFAGMAVNAIEGALGDKAAPAGSSAEDRQKAIENAILGCDPQTFVALRKAEDDFTAQMKQYGIAEEKLVYDDLASARAMQVANKDPTVPRLAWTLILGFIITASAQITAMLVFAHQMTEVPPQVWLQIGNLSGYLANEAKQAAAFFFGSSIGSKAKDDALAQIAKS